MAFPQNANPRPRQPPPPLDYSAEPKLDAVCHAPFARWTNSRSRSLSCQAGNARRASLRAMSTICWLERRRMNKTSPLDEKITGKRVARINTAPESFRKLLTQAVSGKCSPRQAIKAQCAECCGFDREAISDCTCWACPLWTFRPYQKPNEPENHHD